MCYSYESTLTTMHRQHVKQYSLRPENFNFLPHKLQWQQLDRWFFVVVLRNIFLFAANAVTAATTTAIIYSVNIDRWLKHG
jgi:hypothetical protein